MPNPNLTKATANAQAGSKCLAQAIVAANEALFESTDIESRKAEVQRHIDYARAHFDAMFSQIVRTGEDFTTLEIPAGLNADGEWDDSRSYDNL